MSLKLPLLLKISRRCVSMNSPSTSSTSFNDFSFSADIFCKYQAQIDRYSHHFLENLNAKQNKVKLLENKISNVRRDLQRVFTNPDIRLVPIGSAANLLLSDTSDLDMVYLPSQNQKTWNETMRKFSNNMHFRINYMQQVGKAIKRSRVGKNVQVFYSARIPIVRFVSHHKIQVDIQFGNIGPIRSSLFVRTCVEYDERVSLLIHWLTAKFRDMKLLNSPTGLFSRYHVNVLVIHFLQAIPYPVLPDVIQLSPWLDNRDDWNHSVKVLSRQGSLYIPSNTEYPNEKSVGELAIQLVDYYSQIDFEKHAIDTRGRVNDREDDDLTQMKMIDEYFEEPTCRVKNAPHLLKNFFRDLKNMAKEQRFQKLFHE